MYVVENKWLGLLECMLVIIIYLCKMSQNKNC